MVTAVRVSIVVEEVNRGRVAPTRKAIADFVGKAFTLPEPEMERIVDRAAATVAPIRAKNRKKRPMTKDPTNVLRGQALIRKAAEVYRANPEFTAREVYQHIISELEFRISMSFVSFQNGPAGKARRLAASGDPIESADLAAKPKSPKAAKAPTKPKTAKKQASSPKPPSNEIATEAPTATAPKPAVSADGQIRLAFGDQRLEGRLVDGTWHLELTMPDAKIDDFVGLVWRRA